jgi:endonuclease/exonuclease/phosphatase family metal-dependent hydrolase
VAQEGVRRLAKPEQVPAAAEPPPAETNKKLAPILNDFDQQYPRPQDFAKLTPEDLVNRGFYHPDATNLEQVAQFKDKLPTLPDPKVAGEEVAKSLSDMPLAKPDGDLVLGELNAAFMKSDKATFFQKAYSEIVPRHHILTIAEADEAALARIAKDNGYSYAVSSENSKGQAVGFLVNPRLKVLGTHSYDEVAMNDVDVDQRPALRVDLQDRSTGEKFSAIAVHLKKSSADMRAQQTTRLANALEPGFSGYIAGDWNTLITKTSDLNSLYKSGFKLLDPADETGTHAHGNAGRIDGFLIKNMLGSIGEPQVKQFYQNPALVALTDHALLSTTWRLPSSPKLSAYVAGNLALRSAPMENNFSKDR